MGHDTALVEARRFKTILLSNGVPEVSIELVQGRPADGDPWNNQFVVSDFAHHTVSRYSATNKTPCLALCKRGRDDLPGPLCNGYGGWDLCARIICLGYANHPGAGGPLTVPSGVKEPPTYVIPKDSARKYAFGWEFEGGLDEADWTKTLVARNGKKMTFHEFMARCLNGTQEMYDLPLLSHAEHSTWTSRKIDRLRYTQQRGEELMKKYRNPPPAPRPKVDVSEAAEQFKKALGKVEGEPRENESVRILQRALNKIYPKQDRIKVDGIADEKTADAWGHHEKQVGGMGRTRIPDMTSTQALAKKTGGKFHGPTLTRFGWMLLLLCIFVIALAVMGVALLSVKVIQEVLGVFAE